MLDCVLSLYFNSASNIAHCAEAHTSSGNMIVTPKAGREPVDVILCCFRGAKGGSPVTLRVLPVARERAKLYPHV